MRHLWQVLLQNLSVLIPASAAVLIEKRGGVSVPPYLNAIVLRCLAKDPNDRFGSMTHLLSALNSDSSDSQNMSLNAPEQPNRIFGRTINIDSPALLKSFAGITGTIHRAGKLSLVGPSLAVICVFVVFCAVANRDLVMSFVFGPLLKASKNPEDVSSLIRNGDNDERYAMPETALLFYDAAESTCSQHNLENTIENLEVLVKKFNAQPCSGSTRERIERRLMSIVKKLAAKATMGMAERERIWSL